MTLEGTVVNGVIVVDAPDRLKEGMRVRIEADLAEDGPSLGSLLKYAGALNDLPADMAGQHDHYVHGSPRR